MYFNKKSLGGSSPHCPPVVTALSREWLVFIKTGLYLRQYCTFFVIQSVTLGGKAGFQNGNFSVT